MQPIIAALDRGELVQLLADVAAGRLAVDDLLDAMSARDRRWGRWLVRFFFGGR